MLVTISINGYVIGQEFLTLDEIMRAVANGFSIVKEDKGND